MKMTKKEILEHKNKQESMIKKILQVISGDNYITSLQINVAADGVVSVSFDAQYLNKIK